MRALAPAELIRAWELGLARPAAERALALLAAVEPGASPDELAALPLGRRNARLRALREATFGPRYEALARCPTCGERLELAFTGADLAPADGDGPAATPATVQVGEQVVRVRPLDTTDLVAAARCPDVGSARATLARRAVATDGAAPATIPDELLPSLAARLQALDPDAETTLAAACPACGTTWDAALDIAAYVWAEVEAEALRLLREVHGLARGYGWREADILALSPFRRRAYLELVQA
jgi:hypothetical protein